MHAASSTAGAAAARSDTAPALSSREREVLEHRADGRSTAQIAAALSVSTNTVRDRWRHVLSKLDAEEWPEAVHRARVLRII